MSFASRLYQGSTLSGDSVVVTEKFAEDRKLAFDVGNSKGKAVPIQTYWRPRGLQESEVPRLSALRTGRLYPPGNSPGTDFC
jgi:hypothetical protein